MREIFEHISSNGDLNEEVYNEILTDIVGAKIQVDNKIRQMQTAYIGHDIDQLVELYNQISDDELRWHILDKTYDFYLSHIDKMIAKEQYFAIYELLDLFYSNSQVFEKSDDERNSIFVEKSFPILLLEKEDHSSFIAIAGIRFLELLNWSGFKNTKRFLEKFIAENHDNIHIADAQALFNKIP